MDRRSRGLPLQEMAANRALTVAKDWRRLTHRATDGRLTPAGNERSVRLQDANVHQLPCDHYPVAATRKKVQGLVGDRKCREENRQNPGDYCSALGRHLGNSEPNSAVSELHQVCMHDSILANVHPSTLGKPLSSLPRTATPPKGGSGPQGWRVPERSEGRAARRSSHPRAGHSMDHFSESSPQSSKRVTNSPKIMQVAPHIWCSRQAKCGAL